MEKNKSSSPRARNVQKVPDSNSSLCSCGTAKEIPCQKCRDLTIYSCLYLVNVWDKTSAQYTHRVQNNPPKQGCGGPGRELFSKETKIVDVSDKDRAARPLANKCHDRVRKLDEQS